MNVLIYCLMGDMICLKKKFLNEKIKKRQQEAMLTENTSQMDDPSSPIERHVKWKLAHTKQYWKMTSQTTQEIFDKIVSASFIFYLTNFLLKKQYEIEGNPTQCHCNDILNTVIGQPEHEGHVRAVESGVTISQYYGRASRGSTTSSTSISQ